jgi:predicted AlkP superfamily pyrophosphatase or phosphodiesterase
LIDGLRGRTLSTLSTHPVKASNLLEFLERGAFADGLAGVFPTVTYPSHTTLVTGVSPSVHGILGNGMFDPERKTNGAWYWYAKQIKSPALWDRAHAAQLTTGSVSWPVTVGAEIDTNFPECRPYSNEDQLPLYRALCSPGLAADFEQANGVLTTSSESDDVRGEMAVFIVNNRQPDLLLVYLIDMDHQEHLHGPDSAEAFATLEHIDSIIGKI